MRRPFRERESAALLAAREAALLSALDLVLERRRWNRDQVRDFQTSTLQTLVAYAYEHVPFYRAKYDAAEFHPSLVQSHDDLAKIPLLTKDELRKADLAQLKSAAYPAPTRLLSSSGSTGVPSRLYRDEDSLVYMCAQEMALYYDWCDRRPIAGVLYFLDLTPGLDGALADLLRTTVPEERILDSSASPAALIADIERFSPEFISTYPSTLRNIAMTMDRQGKTNTKPRLLHLTSEMLGARTRSLLERVFPRAEIVQTYSSTEGGLIAHQCSAEGRWHLTEESAIYEIVNADGQPTEGMGELVVTNLTNWATPIIRYRGLGDYCRWAATECSCGSDRRSIAHLEGRATESLELADGTLLTPYGLTNALEEVPGVYQFQVIQRGRGDLQVLIVRDASTGLGEEEVCARAQAAIQNLFSAATTCEICCVDHIPSQPGSHKTPLVVSRPSPVVGRTA